MANSAIGLLETKGLIPLVAGTDAMLKAANVTLAGPMKGVGSALVAATITGDVAAVKAALEAGSEAASQVGEVVSAHVIARPVDETMKVLPQVASAPAKKSTSK
ncbi:MAG: BMC domain-containing protein [Opitutales bacterium]